MLPEIINKDSIPLATGAIAAAVGLWEFIKRGRQQRLLIVQEFRKRFREDARLIKIRKMIELEKDMPEKKLPELYYYIGVFEEISFAVQAGLIKKQVASNFFGYYANRCWELYFSGSEAKLKADSDYWIIFRNFVQQMNSAMPKAHQKAKL